MSSSDIYVSCDRKRYLVGKSNILRCQVDLLNTLKKLHNLKVLSREKNDLKKKLQEYVSSTILEIKNLQSKLPTPVLPKTIVKENVVSTKQVLSKGVTKYDNINEELRIIQEKLKRINFGNN